MDAASTRPGATGAKGRFDAFTGLRALSRFDDLSDPGAYVPLPADWSLGLADVVTSTSAIDAGRYKAVNTAGAAVISAVSNALGTLDFPFVFGGDGASFAVPPEQADAAARALAATIGWVGSALDLTLRGTMVSVAEIRAAGHDLKVARFAASADVSYAMFAGGGRSWAEAELKAGRTTLPSVPDTERPDLTGLSCRFEDIHAANGLVLSLIVQPLVPVESPAWRAVLRDVLALAEAQPRAGHPVPRDGPKRHWPPPSLDLEARLGRRGGLPLWMSRLGVVARTAAAHLVFLRGRDFGDFSPARYNRQLVDNSDFRKFDDGLMMTLDCSADVADALEARLDGARAAGLVRYGAHRQDAALITCIVPSAVRPDHIHFVDGAAGGYAQAARDLKRQSG